MRWRAAPLLAWALIASACGTRPISLQTTPRAYTPEDYEFVYEDWTRSEDAFEWSELSEVLRVSATFESWDFRWAYVTRYAEDHGLSETERASILEASLDDSQAQHRFFVTLTGQVWQEQDLTSERSAWRVLLIDAEGRSVPPIAITKVRRPSAAERTYFPTVSPHRHAFRITFPTEFEGRPTLPADARAFGLRITGALGRVDLTWELSRAVPAP